MYINIYIYICICTAIDIDLTCATVATPALDTAPASVHDPAPCDSLPTFNGDPFAFVLFSMCC